jgi:AraC family transcriptional regulator
MVSRHVEDVKKVVRQEGAFSGSEVVYPPQFILREHSHDKACFALCQRGDSVESFGRQVFHQHPGTVLFRPRGEFHSDKVNNMGARCFLLEVPEEWLQHVQQRAKILEAPQLHETPELTSTMKGVYAEWLTPDGASSLAIESLMFELAARLFRSTKSTICSRVPPWLRRARQYLDSCFSEKVSLLQVAREANVHPTHLAREFRRYQGISVGDYLRKCRVNEAARRITQHNGTLVEIALESGFASQAHFSSVFKRLTGKTPSEFRQSVH